MNRKIILGVISLIAIVVSAPLAVFAESKVTQEVETGFQQKDVNSPESKFEEYKEVPNGMFIEHYGLSSEGEKTDFEFNANHIRQDDQSADVKIKGAKYKVEGSWDQTPHLFSKESKTLYTDDGNGHLTLPDPIQQTLQTGGSTNFVTNFSSFAAGAHIQELKTSTNKGNLALGFNLTDTLKLNVGASEEMKKGFQAKGIRIDSDYTEIARPVDFKTYNTNLGLGFSGKEIQWGLNYNFSSFKDGLDSLTIDNPIRFTNDGSNSRTGRISLEPDNYSHNVNFDAGVNLPSHSRFTTKVSFNSMRQNQGLIPYTSNPAFAASDPSLLPENTANAKTINWVQDYNLTSRPLKKVDLGIRYHSDQLNNKTSEINFPLYFQTESSSVTSTITNEPFSFRKDSLIGSAGWHVFEPLQFNLKYGAEWVNRNNREVRKQREDSLNLSTDYKPCRAALIRASYVSARRRMKDINSDDIFAPNARLFDMADRDRNKGNLRVQLNSSKASIGLTGGLGHDKFLPGKGDLTGGNTNYANQLYGFQGSQIAEGGVDIDLNISDQIGVYSYYQYQQEKTSRRGNTGTTNLTSADQKDFTQRQDTRYNTGGIGLNVSAIKNVIDITLGYDVTSSKGNTDFTNLGPSNSTKISPPETKTTKQDFSVKGKVHASTNLAIGLSYLYEKYNVNDWATTGLGLTNPVSPSTNRNIFLGDATHDYKAHIVTIAADYKF